MYSVSPGGIPSLMPEPMPPDPTVDPAYSAAMVAGTSAIGGLRHVAELLDHAVLSGQPAVTVTRDGNVGFLPASGEAVLFSRRLPEVPLGASDPAGLALRLADASHAFDAADVARDAATAAAEAQFDGKQLARELALIESGWLARTHDAAAIVSILSRRLEAAGALPTAVRPESLATAEYLGWGAKNLPVEEFLAQCEALLGGPHADLVGGFLRKQAVAMPPWWKGHAGRLSDLLAHPGLADGGAYGRQQTATRIARQARAGMYARLDRAARGAR